ncbi:uncharacterized protein M421DRAFT_419059 [Didymella exigua CBS 183.55]|uniref:Formin GTPase-binding domain-containing protein n=1 Tax=Didymella exigua CBS 183.55 TaxID=1150837 RepID=A0A6A5RQT5_9PLEO|nr:uncharacterized protein M421DRAFT_419059 [Didymella exigua CBS 183.55]KAF1930029.1 hypothetical protein M421DRAFT_419059 [Didymella exigua CBS 183.55]
MAAPAPGPAAGHRRHKSASVLKSIISQHKRSPSDATALKAAPSTAPYIPTPSATMNAPLLPPDHPHSQQRTANNQVENLPFLPPSPRKQSHDSRSSSPRKGLHKKTLSTVSLRSLGKDKAKDQQSTDLRRLQDEEEPLDKFKKTKSSTNLTSMFGKSKSRKIARSPSKDKENTAPILSAALASEPPPTPIWAQFSSQPLQDVTTTSKVPLNDQRRSLEDEIDLYTPHNYSPSKQRDFFEVGQPSLPQRPAPKERPKSMHVPKSTTSLLGTFSRKKSTDRAPLTNAQGNGERTRDSSPSKSKPSRPTLNRASTDIGRQPVAAGALDPPPSPTKKQNRVMAAVAAFNGRAKQTDAPLPPAKELDPKVVDAEFEEVLESRNIPTHQRAAMRTLKIEVKADFVRTHKLDTPRLSTASIPSIGETDGKGISKLQPTKSTKSRNDSAQEENLTMQSRADGTKRERPTSKSFTFRSNSPTKKSRATELGTAAKPSPIPKSPSSRSLSSDAASNRSVSNSSKTVKSTEFINYLKKNPKPQDVEVGKLHKLRLLLRNETVEWVNTFIQDGGMLELVALLHRIMEIEWREDHEDTLLHELLRCLKGLCTTDSALKQLASISPTLYPALLGMLFDEEHKGPSEFTTRELIIQIIFAHIDQAPEPELSTRAAELLGYLRDPVKEKESSTVPFILQMHTSRPYQVWCKEMTNVTKEVFWIFIHHLQVIPIPPAPSEPTSYARAHFPGPRAIVPAAPYVGGVEWDATNYLATHIDLLNGLLASLPTRDARNELREDLRISGFEKLMAHLRACNPKYYGAVHDSIKVWIGAALEDDWDVKPVRMGSDKNNGSTSPVKLSPKKKAEPAPQIDVPKLDLGLAFDREIDIGGPVGGKKDDDWI